MELTPENRQQLIMFAIAVILGILAVFFMGRFINSTISSQTQQLAKEYEENRKQEKGQLQRELSSMYSDLDTKIKAAEENARKAAEASAKKIKPKEVEKKEETVVPLSAITPSGKRAITLKIDSLSAVGGLISPGEFVDVIAQLKIPNVQKPEGEMDEVTTVLLQNIQVLAVNTETLPGVTQKNLKDQQKSKSIKVTLAVTAEEAGLLTFAETNGKIKLSMRARDERRKENLDVASWEALADFLEREQGTLLELNQTPMEIEVEEEYEEPAPSIQIFKSGFDTN